jgi:murein DD-endopeptidase MepM/ murein hydrolase activator NlpD
MRRYPPLLESAPVRKKPKFGWLLLLVSIILLTFSFIIRHNRRPPSSTVTTEPAQSITRLTFAVQPGDILPFVLNRAGVPAEIADRTIAALRNFGFNFRILRPGDSLILLLRADSLFRIQYWRSYDSIYQISLESVPYPVSITTRDIQLQPALITGEIRSSLYQSLLEQGEKVSLVAAFTEIFDWEIDFFSETQPGDSYYILVNRKLVDSILVGYAPITAARYKGMVGDFYAFRFTDPDGNTEYYNPEGLSLRKTFLKSPLRFSRISSFFGPRFHPIRRVPARHLGIDYAAPTGTPVACVADGRVIAAGWSGGYGRLIRIGHRDGYETRYGHLSGFARGIKPGVAVTQGEIIGYVGSTGLSTGPHLHYEVRKYGSPVNPLRINPPRVSAVKLAHRPIFQAQRDRLIAYLSGQQPLPAPVP